MTYSGLHSGLKEDGYLVQNSGLVNGIQNGLGLDSGQSGYCAEARNYFSYVTPGAIKKNIDSLYRNLKLDGNFQVLDGLWLAPGIDANSALYNFKDPSKFKLTNVGGAPWDIYGGFDPFASPYFTTGLIPTSSGLNYSLNSNCFGYWSLDNENLSETDIGTSDGTNFSSLGIRNAGTIRVRNNSSASSTTFAVSDSVGFFVIKRISSSSVEIWKNGILLTTVSLASTVIPAFEFYISGLNASGVASGQTSRKWICAFIAGGNINQFTFYNSLRSYFLSIGVNV